MTDYSNFHTHTIYCDGKDTPEKLVKEALKLGCKEIGFSGHSYTRFDRSYCMSKANTKKYIEDIVALKKKYRGKIRVYLGVEQDFYSDEPCNLYDYVIGSVHYVKKDDVYIPVDESEAAQKRAVKKYYDGDFYAFAEDYYATVAQIYEKTKCTVVGHFDLITKFNEGCKLFDTMHPRYVAAADRALEKLLKAPVSFEVNTGAMARGLRSAPYPELRLMDRITKAAKKLITTSDCHDASKLLYGFDAVEFLVSTTLI